MNRAAFIIHSALHAARPDVVAAAHAHSVHGKAWSSLGRLLDPITQDACMFFEDHVLVTEGGGVRRPRGDGRRRSPRVLAPTRPPSIRTTACSPWVSRSTRRPGGSSRWNGPAKRNCSHLQSGPRC